MPHILAVARSAVHGFSKAGCGSITLLAAEGKQQVILRTDLEELVSSNKSAMPDGLEKDLQPQDLADLIAFIRAPGLSAK